MNRMARTHHDTPWADAAVAWVAARILIAIGYFAASGIASVLRLSPEFQLHVSERLITWDGRWYYQIASEGYRAHDGSLRFFPLYPLLARVLAWPVGGRYGLTLVVLANAAGYACLVLLYRLVVDTSGDDHLARRAMWLLALFPTAGVFVFAYGEGLMIAFSLVAFLAIRRDRWWVAAAAGLACGLTRPVGVLLTVPFLIDGWLTIRRRGVNWGVLATIAAPVTGTILYLFWVGGAYGDWLLPVTIQRQLRAGFQDPVTRLWDGAVHLSSSQLDLPNLGFAAIFLLLLVPAARLLPGSSWAYCAVTVVVALSAHNINSLGRYGLVAFPFVIVLARLTEDDRAAWLAMACCGAGLVGLTTMATLGAYQP